MRRFFQLRGGQLYLLSDLMWLFGILWKTGKYFSRLWLIEKIGTRQDCKISYTNIYTSHINTNEMQPFFITFYLVLELYMFRTQFASIIRSTINCSSSHWC